MTAVARTALGEEVPVAIAAATARETIERLRGPAQQARPPQLGVQIQPITEPLARVLGLDRPRGARSPMPDGYAHN